MSDKYIRRLGLVQSEYDAARDAIDYVLKNWHRQGVFGDIAGSSPEDFRRASANLEEIFFIRLFTMFEGLLKQHLSEHHPHLTIPEDAKSVWLIDRVSTLQRPRITAPLRDQVHEVRRYRNSLVHSGGFILPPVYFTEALARLSRFVSRLPEPF